MATTISQELLAFADDHQWVHDNWEWLIQHYPEQWIAVKNGRVIASDPDFKSFRSKLSEPAQTCVDFVTREPLEMIL